MSILRALACTVACITVMGLATGSCGENQSRARQRTSSDGRSSSSARREEATAAWVNRVASRYYEARREGDMSVARLGATDGIVYMLNTLRAALDSGTNEKLSFDERLTFNTRYRPVWRQDSLIRSEWDLRVARMRTIPWNVMENWQRALQVAHGDEIDDMWTLGIVADVDPLFDERGNFVVAHSTEMLDRLRLVPTQAIDSLSATLHLGPGWAAALIIQNNDFFDRNAFDSVSFQAARRTLAEHLIMQNSRSR
jgi:hypothetical protein